MDSSVASLMPIYEFNIPSLGIKSRFRAYTIREEKILGMANESEDRSMVLRSVESLISSTCLSKDIKVNELPLTDIAYLLICLRIKSVGERCRFQLGCNNCNHTNAIEFNLSEVTEPPKGVNESSSTIEVSPEINIKLSHPTVTSSIQYSDVKDELIRLLLNHIHSVNDIQLSSVSVDEGVKFVESLSSDITSRIISFIEKIPTIARKVKYACKKCKNKNEIDVSGIDQFFRLVMAHFNLVDYYKENFSMMQHHKYSLSELENLIPFEREIYLSLLSEHIVKENERIAKENALASKGR